MTCSEEPSLQCEWHESTFTVFLHEIALSLSSYERILFLFRHGKQSLCSFCCTSLCIRCVDAERLERKKTRHNITRHDINSNITHQFFKMFAFQL